MTLSCADFDKLLNRVIGRSDVGGLGSTLHFAAVFLGVPIETINGWRANGVKGGTDAEWLQRLSWALDNLRGFPEDKINFLAQRHTQLGEHRPIDFLRTKKGFNSVMMVIAKIPPYRPF